MKHSKRSFYLMHILCLTLCHCRNRQLVSTLPLLTVICLLFNSVCMALPKHFSTSGPHASRKEANKANVVEAAEVRELRLLSPEESRNRLAAIFDRIDKVYLLLAFLECEPATVAGLSVEIMTTHWPVRPNRSLIDRVLELFIRPWFNCCITLLFLVYLY